MQEGLGAFATIGQRLELKLGCMAVQSVQALAQIDQGQTVAGLGRAGALQSIGAEYTYLETVLAALERLHRAERGGGEERAGVNLAGVDPGYIASYPPGVRENGGQYARATGCRRWCGSTCRATRRAEARGWEVTSFERRDGAPGSDETRGATLEAVSRVPGASDFGRRSSPALCAIPCLRMKSPLGCGCLIGKSRETACRE